MQGSSAWPGTVQGQALGDREHAAAGPYQDIWRSATES
jgi:hypothetical protein